MHFQYAVSYAIISLHPRFCLVQLFAVSSALLAEITWRWVPFGDDFSDKQLDNICCLQRRVWFIDLTFHLSTLHALWSGSHLPTFFLWSALPIYAHKRFNLLYYWTTLLAYVSPVSFSTAPWFWMFLKYYQNRNSKKQEFMHIYLWLKQSFGSLVSEPKFPQGCCQSLYYCLCTCRYISSMFLSKKAGLSKYRPYFCSSSQL